MANAPGVASPCYCILMYAQAAIAQLGERQTEDLKVPGSIPGLGIMPESPMTKKVEKHKPRQSSARRSKEVRRKEG